MEGVRSKGAPDPKAAGQQAVAIYTAEAGPPGPRLKQKYTKVVATSGHSSRHNNSGKTGRTFRSEQRMNGGGKPPAEQKLASEAQSAAFQKWRASWSTDAFGPQPG